MLLAWSIALLEFVGGLVFAAGWLVRPLAAYYALQILLGIYLVHGQHGWYTVGPGRNGVEFSVLILASLATLVIAGHGRPLLWK
jgi:putative oxidoreductase